MIDFTNCKQTKRAYSGANGNKIGIIYNDEHYLLKFPPIPSKSKTMSYANSCFSEYLGSQIFNIIGLNAQQTLLGKYYFKGKEKIVVACKDFTNVGIVLQDFASLKNQIITSEHNGYGTNLEDILQSFNEQTSVDALELNRYFWDMFIVDALIGNWDRHNGNWGFLYDTMNDTVDFAPIFDCGSSLYPQADESIMQKVFIYEEELNLRLYEIPYSAIVDNGRKIRYFDFISSLKNKYCNEALKRILPKIDMVKINDMIDNTDFLTSLQIDFYKKMLKERKEKILDYSLNKLVNLEKQSKNKGYER